MRKIAHTCYYIVSLELNVCIWCLWPFLFQGRGGMVRMVPWFWSTKQLSELVPFSVIISYAELPTSILDKIILLTFKGCDMGHGWSLSSTCNDKVCVWALTIQLATRPEEVTGGVGEEFSEYEKHAISGYWKAKILSVVWTPCCHDYISGMECTVAAYGHNNIH